MPRFHNINGVRVQFTAQEELDRDAKEQAWRDFYGLQDVSMTQDMTNYRQALRDLPEGLTTVEEVEAVTFPTKP